MDVHIDAGCGPLALLRGGPPGMPELLRLPAAEANASRLVVAYYGRHQHFERTEDSETVDGTVLPVFRFTYSTAIAE
ncbi:DUF5988 family protein [Streptomyces sp. NPDC089915]|uniref:DUF5988 family protein n=1 Tax=Streptomyces sp. NPDC089915 TaxID=3155186 RepID=UPI003449A1F9